VRNLTNYGAFIDLGGIDGLLHISEMSWTHVDHPSPILQTGEIIRVMVLNIEEDGKRISLSRRQILPDPWKEAAGKLSKGSIAKAQITRIVSTGAFARLADAEMEGFIPIGEMSLERITSPDEVIEKGQQVEVKIVEVRPQARKMTLSLTEAVQEKERHEYQKYMDSQPGMTIKLGDQFGEVLQQAKATIQESGEVAAEEVTEQSAEQVGEQLPVEDSAEPAEEPAVAVAQEAADEAEAAEEVTEQSAEQVGEQLPVEDSAESTEEPAVAVAQEVAEEDNQENEA